MTFQVPDLEAGIPMGTCNASSWEVKAGGLVNWKEVWAM